MTRQDRADSSDVIVYVQYFEAESISDVYRYAIKSICPPEWIDNLQEDHPLVKGYNEVSEMNSSDLNDYFQTLYAMETQQACGNTFDKWTIEVREWKMPAFERI